MSGRTVCIQCGHEVGETAQLNRLSNGENCPACAERALTMVLPALPANRGPHRIETEAQPELPFTDADEPA